MKRWLVEIIACPACIHEPETLELQVHEELDGDIKEGSLQCPSCGVSYPIQDGVAVILSERSAEVIKPDTGYESRGMLSSYLWSHYSDLLGEKNFTDAYLKWSSYFKKSDGCALDIGCAVGRLSFELSRTHPRVIGVDTSFSFIQKARELLTMERLKFELIIEGDITESRSCRLDKLWNFNGVEFIVADALNLPFHENSFRTVATVNILEKVANPILHLKDINRVLDKQNSMLLFSDPFSWDESVLDKQLWLSGNPDGKYKGRGTETISRLFSNSGDIFSPSLSISHQGDVVWKIRKTENLWEHINSKLIVANR